MTSSRVLPPAVASYLNGEDPQGLHESAIVVCTIDDDGFAHPALLSRGEVVAIDEQTLRLALASSSRTSRHARRLGRMTLIFVHGGAAYYIKGVAHEVAPRMRANEMLGQWQVEIRDVRVDHPDPRFDAGAYLTGGITFVNPPERQARSRAVVAELREPPSTSEPSGGYL